MSINEMIEDMAKAAKIASRSLRTINRKRKDAALSSIAKKLVERKKDICSENERDLRNSNKF